ncbi:hypothetical protein NLX86_13490 [Streptomyces sp. A3M-1-3]|uniref:hypothetical protein n=1 Tax=Streptomyces sp. A3M-1-3 TaxID=2962044 RepID=UPI0020B75AFE|nr:hypothetical protein [Streptomyces sp. A3M-1-3]MCP3819089.1 hypothetical protein [Streptomyces sp. A3M-1-3]
MDHKTTMTGPIHLALPVLEPTPVDGCKVCGALGKQPEAARRSGDMSQVSDCNVEVRNHPRRHR